MGRLQDTGTKPVSMIAVLAVSLSTVIAMLDSTIANVALPLIAKDFSVSESASILIINAYQFAVIATLLPFSALGRTLGNPRIFMAGVVLFALSSLGCSLSTSLNMLTLFRIIQGLGAAAILSVNAALIQSDLSATAPWQGAGHQHHGRLGFGRRGGVCGLHHPVAG